MSVFEHLDYQISVSGQPHPMDSGGASIESCAALVAGCDEDFDIRRSAEWGGGIVATIRGGELRAIGENYASSTSAGNARKMEQDMDYMQDVEQARQALEAAMQELEPLRASMPDGADKLRVLNATTHLVTASLALNFRAPGVPSRLDFVATTPDLAESLHKLVQAGRDLGIVVTPSLIEKNDSI